MAFVVLLAVTGCGAVRVETAARNAFVHPCKYLAKPEVEQRLGSTGIERTVVYIETPGSWECWWVNRGGEHVRTAAYLRTKTLREAKEHLPENTIAEPGDIGQFARVRWWADDPHLVEMQVLDGNGVHFFVDVCLKGKSKDALVKDVLALASAALPRVDRAFPGRQGDLPAEQSRHPESCDF